MKCNIQEPMHIHSLGGELREATIVERIGGNEYIAEYGGCLLYTSPSPRDRG